MNNQQILLDYIKNDLLKGRMANLNVDDDLLDSGILNSLGILQLVAFIDERLGIQVPDEDVVYENFHSVAALTSYLDGLASA
jgi:acyl carrier protein